MTKQTDYTSMGREISTAEFKGRVLAKLEYIEASIDTNQVSIAELEIENQNRKGWQENFNTKSKIYVGVALFIGGAIIWIGDKLFDLFVNK